MKVNNIDFKNIPINEELLYEKANNPIVDWREKAKIAYQELLSGSDELHLINIIINNWIDYIHFTKGKEYAESHYNLSKINMMEELNIAINGFNL